MSASAVFLAGPGVAMSFLSHELLAYVGASVSTATVVLVQIAGALYLGFAILNWSARGVIIGGIYARPVALANFLHFVIVAIVFIKLIVANFSMLLSGVTAAYAIFAAWFGLVLCNFPGKHAGGA